MANRRLRHERRGRCFGAVLRVGSRAERRHGGTERGFVYRSDKHDHGFSGHVDDALLGRIERVAGIGAGGGCIGGGDADGSDGREFGGGRGLLPGGRRSNADHGGAVERNQIPGDARGAWIGGGATCGGGQRGDVWVLQFLRHGVRPHDRDWSEHLYSYAVGGGWER